jgi:hypothetical protein
MDTVLNSFLKNESEISLFRAMRTVEVYQGEILAERTNQRYSLARP